LALEEGSRSSDELVRTRLPIQTGQPNYLSIDADLFADFAHGRVPRCLTLLDATARKVPRVDVASVAQEDTVVVIEDDCERARLH